MYVWITNRRARGTRFHSNPDCHRAKRKGQKEWKKVFVLDLNTPRPCRHCFPEAPSIQGTFRRCDQGCKGPCPHAGGVLVRIERSNGRPQMEWVWPDKAAWYEPVEYIARFVD